jgi:hypothetical protein
MTTRAEWQQLAEDRILDAQAHVAAGIGRWSAAYYYPGNKDCHTGSIT